MRVCYLPSPGPTPTTFSKASCYPRVITVPHPTTRPLSIQQSAEGSMQMPREACPAPAPSTNRVLREEA